MQPAEVLDGPQGESVEPPADTPTVVEKDGQVTGIDWSTAPKKAPEELTVIPLVEGDGPEAAKESMVTFDYYGAVYGEDKPFDESYSREPTAFGVGVNQLIPAWDKAIAGPEAGQSRADHRSPGGRLRRQRAAQYPRRLDPGVRGRRPRSG